MSETVLAILERLRGIREKKEKLRQQQSALDRESKQLNDDLDNLLDGMFK